MSLSVIIPVYNEVQTINQIIKKILEINIQLNEIIIVDDYSNDGTYENLSEFKNNKLFKIIRHKKYGQGRRYYFSHTFFDK